MEEFSAFGVIHKASQDGKYIKAGVNDQRVRSKGERRAAMKGAIPGSAMALSGGALGIGASVHAMKNADKLSRPGTTGAKVVHYYNQGSKFKAAKEALKTKHGMAYAGGVGLLAAGAITNQANMHRSSNKWRKKEGLPQRKYWSGKPVS